jgi:catechol-2,3-dioxygenase
MNKPRIRHIALNVKDRDVVADYDKTIFGLEENAAHADMVSNTFGAVAESWIRDPEGNRVDIAEHGWPI